MPDGAGGMQSMGPVNPQKVVKNQGSTDELQRALEGELVTFLRDQNSRLLSEVAALRNQLEKSWVSSSPWSAVGGTSGDSHAPHGRVHNGRQGRHGSRTPRGRERDMAVSPEFQHQKPPGKYTPNGTRVPDGPPPEHALPPVPPIPFEEDAVKTGENQLQQSSFVSGPPEDGLDLYDTCESKPTAKNGDASWKPVGERDGVLSAREAKQMWLEREVRSLKVALDRVAIPPQVQQSPYWNSGFDIDGKIQSSLTGHANAATGNRRSASGGCGEASLQARAASGGCGEDALHGRIAFGGRREISPQARAAIGGSGDISLLDRAATGGCGDISLQDRAFAVAHDHQRGSRASSMHGDLFAHDRAPFEHGDLRPDDRAFLHRGDLYGQGRALTDRGEHLGRARAFAEHGGGFDGGRACRHDVDGHQDFCHQPRHGVGGGGNGDGIQKGSSFSPWAENAGGMNTKAELPDLPQNSSPLQFGDWLHLSALVMKDISGVTGWWWENTLREAKCYYEQWRGATMSSGKIAAPCSAFRSSPSCLTR